MSKLWAALALAGTGCLVTGTAQAEPVKIAVIETLYAQMEAVTPEDLMRAAKKYFTPERRTVVVLKGSQS